MTRKRFKKLLMARGVEPKVAQWLIDYLTETRQFIERHELVMTYSTETKKFRIVKVHSYAKIYKSLTEEGELLV